MNVIGELSHLTQLPVWVVFLVAVATWLFGAGRLTRVLTFDTFPPAVWLRTKWDLLTEGSEWNLLLHCHWCLSFWITTFIGLWFVGGLWVDWLAWSWWAIVGMLALSYLVAMVIERDTKD